MSRWVAILVKPRGVLLDGEHAVILNAEVFSTKEAAMSRAEQQQRVEGIFTSGAAESAATVQVVELA